MTPTLRVDILDGIVEIAKRAVDRLCEKLEKLRGTGTVIEVEEEFRLLTLQVRVLGNVTIWNFGKS